MADRPAILSARVQRLSTCIADADDLKRKAQTDRPNDASLDQVRAAYRDAVQEVADAGGSVAAVENVATPTERLK